MVIFFLFILTFFFDSIGLIFTFLLHRNNSLPSNCLLLAETLLLYAYFILLFSSKRLRKVIIGLGILFFIIWFYKLFTLNIDKYYYDYCSTLENVSIFILSLFYFYNQVIQVNTPFIYKEPSFWIVSAYFIYIAGTLFLILYIPTLTKEEIIKYYPLNYVFTIIRSIMLSIAMIIKPEKNNFKDFSALVQEDRHK